jgi:quinol monooxygenase YgiN
MRFLSLSPLVLGALALSFAAAAAQEAQQPAGPVEVAKYVEVQSGQEKTALAALRKYRAATRGQDGNSTVLLLEETGRPSRFVIVERWKDDSAYKAHLGAPASTQFTADLATIRRAPDDERAHSDFLVEGGGKVPASAIFVLTHADVTPPRRPPTEDALKTLVEASRKEPGVVEFDVFRQQGQPNHFTMYEVWSNARTFAAHGKAAAALGFRQTLAPLLGALYDERIYREIE